MKGFYAPFLALCLASPLTAQEVQPCDWTARADNIVEPWEQNTATFADGAVRIALMDTVEPAASPLHLLVLSPPYDELGLRQCRILSLNEGTGFSDAEFHSLKAGYDPATGLTFQMRVAVGLDVNIQWRNLSFTVNQASGTITAQMDSE